MELVGRGEAGRGGVAETEKWEMGTEAGLARVGGGESVGLGMQEIAQIKRELIV